METKDREIRFGMVAVRKGYVTPDQIVEAFEIQMAEDLSKGKHNPIGMILVNLGIITKLQLDEILEILKTEKSTSSP
ncbi:MAG: hypothetical protein ABII26_04940 [Pseudomonadota bacterium]